MTNSDSSVIQTDVQVVSENITDTMFYALPLKDELATTGEYATQVCQQVDEIRRQMDGNQVIYDSEIFSDENSVVNLSLRTQQLVERVDNLRRRINALMTSISTNRANLNKLINAQ